MSVSQHHVERTIALLFLLRLVYVLRCGLLSVPASIWNIALTERLPSSFAPAEFWRDIPAPLRSPKIVYESLCSSFRSSCHSNAASGRTKHEGVTDVLNVEVEGVRRPVRSLENCERFLDADGDLRLAVIQRE